jgi:hypothetical protein
MFSTIEPTELQLGRGTGLVPNLPILCDWIRWCACARTFVQCFVLSWPAQGVSLHVRSSSIWCALRHDTDVSGAVDQLLMIIMVLAAMMM